MPLFNWRNPHGTDTPGLRKLTSAIRDIGKRDVLGKLLESSSDPDIQELSPVLSMMEPDQAIDALSRMKLFRMQSGFREEQEASEQRGRREIEEMREEGRNRRSAEDRASREKAARIRASAANFGIGGEEGGGDLASAIKAIGMSKADFERILANPDLIEKHFPGYTAEELQAAGAQVFGSGDQQQQPQEQSFLGATGKEALQMGAPFLPAAGAKVGGGLLSAAGRAVPHAGMLSRLGGWLSGMAGPLAAGGGFYVQNQLKDLIGQPVYNALQAQQQEQGRTGNPFSQMQPMLPTGQGLDIVPENVPFQEGPPEDVDSSSPILDSILQGLIGPGYQGLKMGVNQRRKASREQFFQQNPNFQG
jgi:hypothetical protein